MPRQLSTAFLNAISSDVVNVAAFVLLDYFEGPLRLWSGVGTISYDGHDWIGVGSLGSIETQSQTRDLNSSGLRLSLSGVDGTLISSALSAKGKGRGRPFKIWLACMDDDFTSIITESGTDAIYLLMAGFIDSTTIDDTGDSSAIILTVENELVRLFRASQTRYTDKDHQRVFPGDVFFEYTAKLAGKELYWGRDNPSQGTQGTRTTPAEGSPATRNGARANSRYWN